jgi:DNA-binding NarL/FixJ family response regulator
MANLLKTSTREEIMRLLQLGWSHRRIARELKVDRGTVSRVRTAGPTKCDRRSGTLPFLL